MNSHRKCEWIILASFCLSCVLPYLLVTLIHWLISLLIQIDLWSKSSGVKPASHLEPGRHKHLAVCLFVCLSLSVCLCLCLSCMFVECSVYIDWYALPVPVADLLALLISKNGARNLPGVNQFRAINPFFVSLRTSYLQLRTSCSGRMDKPRIQMWRL